MDSNTHKRRRIEMALPDGFATARSRRPVYKPVVPQFSSAFNEDSNFRSTKESTDCPKERRYVLSNSSTTESAEKLKERRSILLPLVPSRPIQSDTRPNASNDRTSTFLIASHQSLISGQLKTDAPNLQLRPPPKPPIIPLHHTPITASALLKSAIPPPLLANKHSPKDLKSLQPISKTRVALAADLSTDNGIAELASIFLYDQHPDITLPNSHPENHDGRGLELSPEKKGKGKNPKFTRGGLAAHAAAFFEQSHTSLVLWQKETERRANILSSSDLRVSIVKILQNPHTTSERLISPGITLCRIWRETTSSHSHSRHKSYSSDDLYRIVFSFPSCLTKSKFNDPHQFSQGRTVRICWPWQEISFTEKSILPATLPLSSSEPTLTPDIAINDKTLICSRFLIL